MIATPVIKNADLAVAEARAMPVVTECARALASYALRAGENYSGNWVDDRIHASMIELDWRVKREAWHLLAAEFDAAASDCEASDLIRAHIARWLPA